MPYPSTVETLRSDGLDERPVPPAGPGPRGRRSAPPCRSWRAGPPEGGPAGHAAAAGTVRPRSRLGQEPDRGVLAAHGRLVHPRVGAAADGADLTPRPQLAQRGTRLT